MKTKKSFGTIWNLSLVAAITLAAANASAALFVKTNNVVALNTASSWTNNAVPGAADIAQWDSTVATLNNTTNGLGGNVSWGGLRVLNPVGAIVITNSANTLTNGAYGIDMSAASQNLTLSNTVYIAPGAMQQWNVANGQTLTVAAIPTKPGQPSANTGVLQVGTTGTVLLGTTTVSSINDNQGNPWVTYGLNDWAALNAGQVVAATYTAAPSALTAGVNNDITGNNAGGAASAVQVLSLRFNAATPYTLGIANSATSRTLTACGVLVTANSAGGTIGGTANTSFIRPTRSTIANTSFNVIQNSPSDFTISAILSDASSSAPVHLVKSGTGNLILSNSNTGNSYTGGTDINGGTLTVIAGCKPGGGAVNVNNTGRLVLNASNTTFVASVAVNSGGTNRININIAGAQQYVSGVTFNAGSTACEFVYATGVGFSTTTAPLLVSNVTANGAITVNIYSGTPSVGIFPLIKYTNSLAGTGFSAFSLGLMPLRTFGYLSNDTANTSIDLVVTNVTEPLSWATGGGIWDLATTPNWEDSIGNVTTYQQANGYADSVVFADSLSGASPVLVTNNSTLTPSDVTVNASKNYTISGTGNIAGTTVLNKTGTGTLILSTTNTFSGGLYISNGIVNFSSVTNLGNGGINFYGGTLQYASGIADDVSVRGVYFGPGGGTIDDGGNTITLANAIGNSGVGGFTKTGAGSLTLTGTNKYTGNTIVANGTLALAASTYISNSAAIIVNSGGILDAATSGVGLALNTAAHQILAGGGTVNGNVTVPSGTTVSAGTNGVVGTLTFGNNVIFNGGTNVFDVSTNSGKDLLVVNGNLTLTSGNVNVNVFTGTLTNGVYKLIQYSGLLASGAGSSANLTISGFSQLNKIAALSDATAGEIDLVISSLGGFTDIWQGDGSDNYWDIETTFNFTNTSGTPVQFVQGDKVTFDNTSPNTTVNIEAAVQPGSVTVNGTQSYTFQSSVNGKISGATGLTNNSTGTLIIATADNNSGNTVINAGTIQVGNGGSGDIGSGSVLNNGALVFDQADGNVHTVEQITGTGPVTQSGSATTVLDQNNSYSGGTLVSAGVVQVGASGIGNVGGATGSLGTAPVTNNSALVISRSGSYALNNNISGSGGVSFAGSGTVTLSGANTYLNNTVITNGVVTLGASEEIPDGNNVPGATGWLILDGGVTGGTFDLAGFNETVNALSGNAGTIDGTITNTGASATTTNTLIVLNGGTTYNGVINESAGGSKIQVVLHGTTELRMNGNSTYTGGTLVGDAATIGVGPGGAIGVGSITLSNGTSLLIHNNGGTGAFVNNVVSIPANSAGAFNSTQTGNGYAGSVVGGTTATNLIMGPLSLSAANLYQYDGFFGTVVISNTESIRFSATSGITEGGTNTIFDDEGTLDVRNNGAVTLGALEGAGAIGNPTVSGAGTWNIGAANISTIFSGSLTGTNNFIKVGTGTLTLNGGESITSSSDGFTTTYTTNYANNLVDYEGSTTVSNGVLALVAPVVLTNWPTPITMASSSAVIDATAMGYIDPTDTYLITNALFEVISGQTLTGVGTILASNLLLDSGSTFTVGLPLGNLTNSYGNIELAGTVNMAINATNSPLNSGLVANSFTIDGTAALVVTNIGSSSNSALQGLVFHLFNHAVSGFSSVTLPTLTSPFSLQNNLAVDGTIVVLGSLGPNTSTFTNSVSFGNSLMTMSWPLNHTGFYLEAQTNSLATGLSNNWVVVSNVNGVVPSSTNLVNVPVDPNNTVFYRLIYPHP